jgi:hypothetical protein
MGLDGGADCGADAGHRLTGAKSRWLDVANRLIPIKWYMLLRVRRNQAMQPSFEDLEFFLFMRPIQIVRSKSKMEHHMQTLNLREVGLAQRLLIWGFLAGILGALPILLFITVPFLLYCTWRISSALQLHIVTKVFCMLLVLLPIVAAITILVLNGKATRTLQDAGIRVGLIGAKTADLPDA